MTEIQEFLFSKRIMAMIEGNVNYTVYIKVRYNVDSYFMVGNQFGFIYDSPRSITELYNIFISKLEDYLKEYHLIDDDIVYIEISFRKLDKKLLSDFIKDIDNKKGGLLPSPFNNNKELLNIPISVHGPSLGESLPVTIDNNIITFIKINIDGTYLNFLYIIKSKTKLLKKSHKDHIISFDYNFRFYLLKDVFPYVLAVKHIDEFSIEKIRYSMNGVVLSHIIDTRDGNIVTRKLESDKKEIVFIDNKIVSTKKKIILNPISKSIKSNTSFISNPNIGVIDTETFTTNEGIQKIYALGFKTNLYDKPIIYYINKDDLDSDKIVLEMINELLRPKYNKTIFYCHNLSRYDIVFILKILCIYNDSCYESKYKISTILRKDKIIQVTISRDKNSFTIKDSYAVLPQSLHDLGKSFSVETLKTKFPYRFSKQYNLFYIGETPDILYYDNISQKEYKDLYQKNWSFYDETVKYLGNDLISLYQVISKANKQVFHDFNLNLTDVITISGLAVRIFIKDFYKGNIPAITKASMYNDIKQAYYGGITEVYKPCGYDLFYYDVNSLYPYVSLNDMPGIICSKLNYYTNKSIDDLFGFFNCIIEAPLDSYLGLLPVRDKSGINFPVGKWKGWYFSEELKFAKVNGYKINVIEGYSFNREVNVFKEYVDSIYRLKSNPINVIQKSMAKSLLNNLLGRFGISLDKAITEIVSEKYFDRISSMHKVTSYKRISSENILVSYVPKIDNDIINSHNLDIIKVLNQFKDKEVQYLNVSSVAISAAVTAYGRMYISNLKLNILKNGGKIFYSDTDSIVTNLNLNNLLVNPNEIGKLKLEHKIKVFLFQVIHID